ncbi:MAG: hypothetical protein QM485_04780 [Flavobacteriaceae bacterium]
MKDKYMDRISILRKKMVDNEQENIQILQTISKIENNEKWLFARQHFKYWFKQAEAFVLPLRITDEKLYVISVGEFEGKPFIEYEYIAIDNFDISHPLGTEAPKMVRNILKEVLELLAL